MTARRIIVASRALQMSPQEAHHRHPVQAPPEAAVPPQPPCNGVPASNLRHMAAPAVACISSGSLLAGGTEVLIEHHGSFYRLKQTALGKLILTK